jgi:pyridinium-3,5-bisthiocarboxylic acid mononucleotide nickel chelatase
MRYLYLQCQSGISGDMFLSALLDAGLDEKKFRGMLKSIGVADHEVTVSKTMKKGISATKLTVEPDKSRPHLHVADIRRIFSESGLDRTVIEKAHAVFDLIIEAESKVHGMPAEKVHLHEVSGLDTIVDILGVSWGLHEMQIEKVWSTPINVGSGDVTFSHGTVPVPAPATALILKNIPIIDDGLPGERTTPTGAALAAVFTDSFDSPGHMLLQSVGYGAGCRDDGNRPNVLRALICEGSGLKTTAVIQETLTLLETDIDDDTAEILGHCMDKLGMTEGVLDVTILPTVRKKSRPGQLVRILCKPSVADSVRQILFAETGTLGIRDIAVNRVSLPRTFKQVQTPWGSVGVKYAGNSIAPEFEDCRKLADSAGVPLKEVYRAALTNAE